MKDWIEEKMFKKLLWRVRARLSISLEKWGGIKFSEEKNLSKCSSQILLLTKLKENQSLGTEEDKNEKERKEKLISINK